MVGRRKEGVFKVPKAKRALRTVNETRDEEPEQDANFSVTDNEKTLNSSRRATKTTNTNDATRNVTKSTIDNDTTGRDQNLLTVIRNELSPILETSQHKRSSLKELLNDAMEVYNKVDKKAFATVLWRMMVIPFQVKDKNDTVDRMVDFFHSLLSAIFEHDGESTTIVEQSQDGDETVSQGSMKQQFRQYILRLCEKCHQDSRPQVRARVVQTIVKIFDSCPNLADELSTGLKRKLTNALLERLKDKIHSVRCEAAKGLCYFQLGKGCPITLQMMEFIRMDPRPEVRKALVYSIVLDYDDYGDFLDRIMDVHPDVRKACMHQIREIPMDQISIEDREKIVECGLRDVAPSVRSETTKVIHYWFGQCDNDPLVLLQKFDVYNRSKLCITILNMLFEDADEEAWSKLENGMLVDQLVPLSEVSELKIFVWWYLFTRFSSKPYFLEKLSPTMPALKAYFKKLLAHLAATKNFDDDDRIKIVGLFLKIVLYLPVEEAGRMVLDEIAREGFKCKYNSAYHMKQLVLLLHKAHPNGCDEVLLENIRDMMELLSSSRGAPDESVGIIAQRNMEDEIRKMKLTLSEKLHSKFHLVKDKEELIKANNYLEAHKIQEKIIEIELDIATARTEIKNRETRMSLQTLEVEEPTQEPTVNYSAEAIYHAFSALTVHLKLIHKISPYIRNFFEAEVCRCIFRPEPVIRTQVLELMTLVGEFNLPDAVIAVEMCLQAIINHDEDVKLTALQCVFDMLLKYGLESFEEPQIIELFSKSADQSQDTVDHMLVQLLMSFFKSTDNESMFHVTVLGMLKLLIMNRIAAPKIVATLLTFWADSANEGTKHYHDIGAGLSVYVQQSSQNAETVARALTPSVSKVVIAPARSNFRRVDPDKLIGFVIMQTDPIKLKHFSSPFMPHQIIAFDVLDEIRKKPLSTDNGVFAKALKGLSLNGMTKDALQELKTKLKQVMRNELKSVRMSLEAFGKYLDELNPEVKAIDLMSDQGSDSESEIDGYDTSQSMFQSWRAPAPNTANEGTVNSTAITMPGLESLNSSISRTFQGMKSNACDDSDSGEDFLETSS